MGNADLVTEIIFSLVVAALAVRFWRPLLVLLIVGLTASVVFGIATVAEAVLHG